MKRRVRELPGVAGWPQMLALVERPVPHESSVWEYPVAACRAVGGPEDAALPAAAAVFCSVISIHMVDDMLDEDPRGDHHFLGVGPVSNLALAFQAAGHLLLDAPEVPREIRPALQTSFAGMSLATCFGQGLDARELQSEEEYWKVVESKTPPLFSEALRMGALLGGAAAETAGQLAHLGRILGRLIQVSDDVTDALDSPARSDWKRRANNLPILYAMTAPHPEREEFLRLSACVEDPVVLAEAQKILFRSGAVSYCTFKLIELSREAQDQFAAIRLQEPEWIARLVDLHLAPLHRLLELVGVEEPAAIALPQRT